MFNTGGEMIDYWMGATPMGRPGEPEELGGIVVYLASDASSFAQGSVFTIDGGYTAFEMHFYIQINFLNEVMRAG